MATVSIIMNCLNSAAYLREALESVYCQSYRDWEIVFWDNASKDESPLIAKSFDSRLKYYRGEEVVPLGRARNYALAKITGEYIAFLDCDDLWMPDKLSRQMPLFENNPEAGIVFSDAIRFSEDGRQREKNWFIPGQKPPRGKIFSFALTGYNHTICMPTVMLRRQALEGQKEWFDERFQIATDFDLFLRIAHDWQADYVDEPLARYRVHPGATSKKYFECIPWEMSETLKKFKCLYPDFDSACKRENAVLARRIDNLQARSLLKTGNPREARAILKKNPWSLEKLRLYGATFLPSRMLRMFGK